MSGEATTRLYGVIAQASARMSRRLMLIDDLYAPDTQESDVRELLLKDIMEHYDSVGHMAPADGCNHPTCQSARLFWQQAVTQYQQQALQGPQDGNTGTDSVSDTVVPQ